jgi:hypothetical protein
VAAGFVFETRVINTFVRLEKPTKTLKKGILEEDHKAE